MRTASGTAWLGLRDLGFVPSPGELQRGLEDLAGLAFDRTLRLAVTGLRQGGKTVFITALVHHLLSGRELPFLTAAHEGRLLGARLLPTREGDLPAFPFAAARAAGYGERKVFTVGNAAHFAWGGFLGASPALSLFAERQLLPGLHPQGKIASRPTAVVAAEHL